MVGQRWCIRAVAVLFIVWIGCTPPATSPPRAAKTAAPKPQALSNLPIRLAVHQRSTTVVPGSNGALRLTTLDITRGQVIVSLVNKQGEAELAATSLKPGDSVSFDLGTETFQFTLTELNNSLVGDDTATFTISTGTNALPGGGSTKTMTEAEKIERFLAEIESAKGDVFIRNGVEYSAKDAADHLRTKLNAAGDRIETAEQFIQHVASASSLTGELYRVRLANGTEVLAADYLREKLAQLEAGSSNDDWEH
jgi:hypothetical protein